MKILFIVESYIPQLCGITSVTKYLAEGLALKGHKIILATQSHFSDDKLVEEIAGVEIHRFKIHRNLLKKPIGDTKGFIDFVLSQHVDAYVFECINSITSDIMLPHIDKLGGTLILHSHGFPWTTSKPFAVMNDIKHTIGNTYNYLLGLYGFHKIYPNFIAKFDQVLSLSIVSSDIPLVYKWAKKLSILDNAADDMFFEDITLTDFKRKFGIKFDHYMISIANYTVVKQQMLMVKAYLKSKCKGISLVMIGGSKSAYYQYVKDYLSNNLSKYPGKDVVMLTGIERKEFPLILHGASVYLTSSTYEEFSISIIEAMAQGVPFISTNVGNARILPGGITVYDNEKYADAIDEMISNEKHRQELSVEAKRYAFENCRKDVAVNRMEQIIKRVI